MVLGRVGSGCFKKNWVLEFSAKIFLEVASAPLEETRDSYFCANPQSQALHKSALLFFK